MIKNMKLLTGMQIKLARRAADVTKKQLSDCAGVGTTTITRIEAKPNEIHKGWNLLHKIEKCLTPRLAGVGWKFTESGGLEPMEPMESIDAE